MAPEDVKFQEDLNKYGFKNEDVSIASTGVGLTEETVRMISKYKQEPEWMLEFRLKALKIFKQLPMPEYGPDLSDMDFDTYTYFTRVANGEVKNWDEVPETIKNTLQQASQRWDEIKKEHPDFIRNGKILFSCLLDYIPIVGYFKACFELKTEKDLITKEELDDIDKILSYISVGIPAFKSINKIIKVPFTKTYKFFEGCDDYGGFVKSLYDMCDGDE